MSKIKYTKMITIRVTEEQYEKLQSLIEKIPFANIQNVVRKIIDLFNGEIK